MAGARRVSDRAGRAAMLLISQSARVLANHRSTAVLDLIAVSRLIVLGVVLREGSQELTLKCLGVLGEHTVNTPGTMFLSLESRALA